MGRPGVQVEHQYVLAEKEKRRMMVTRHLSYVPLTLISARKSLGGSLKRVGVRGFNLIEISYCYKASPEGPRLARYMRAHLIHTKIP